MTRDQAIDEAGRAFADALAELARDGVTVEPATEPVAEIKPATTTTTVKRPRRKAA